MPGAVRSATPPTAVWGQRRHVAKGRGRNAAPLLASRWWRRRPRPPSGGGVFRGPFFFLCFFMRERPAGPGPAHVTSGGSILPPSLPATPPGGRRRGCAPWSSRVQVRAPAAVPTQRHHFAQCETIPVSLASVYGGASEREKRQEQEPLSKPPRGGRSPAHHTQQQLDNAAHPALLMYEQPRNSMCLPMKSHTWTKAGICPRIDCLRAACGSNLRKPDQSAPRPRRQPRLCPPHFCISRSIRPKTLQS